MPFRKDHGKQERPAAAADTGLILLDHSFKIVALDRGAAAIIREQAQPLGSPQAAMTLPREILNTVRDCKISAIQSLRMYTRFGKNDYVCRACILEWQNWLSTKPLTAIHLAKVCSSNDAISDVSLKFQLTTREQEVLRGISLGLSSKVMADRMKISPNTVKAFLRLIMIKMGVASRAGIVANILSQTTMDMSSVVNGMSSQRYEFREMRVSKAAAGDGSGRPQGTDPQGD